MSYGNNFTFKKNTQNSQPHKIRTNANADFYESNDNIQIQDNLDENETHQTNPTNPTNQTNITNQDKIYTLAGNNNYNAENQNMGQTGITNSEANLEKYYDKKQQIIGQEIDRFIEKKKEQLKSTYQSKAASKYSKYLKKEEPVLDNKVNKSNHGSMIQNTPKRKDSEKSKSSKHGNNSFSVNKENVISYDEYKANNAGINN